MSLARDTHPHPIPSTSPNFPSKRKIKKKLLYIPHTRPPHSSALTLPQNIGPVLCPVNQVFKVILQRLGIGRLIHPLKNIEDDGCVAVGGEVDFLVVGDLADGAVGVG